MFLALRRGAILLDVLEGRPMMDASVSGLRIAVRRGGVLNIINVEPNNDAKSLMLKVFTMGGEM